MKDSYEIAYYVFGHLGIITQALRFRSPISSEYHWNVRLHYHCSHDVYNFWGRCLSNCSLSNFSNSFSQYFANFFRLLCLLFVRCTYWHFILSGL